MSKFSTALRAFMFIFCCGFSQAAFAHAVLMGSSPKANETLSSSPKELRLNFNEGVGPIFFKILDKNGKESGSPGEIQIDGSTLILPLGESLQNGTYVLTYRVISADTHPVGATFGFSVGEPMADMSEMKAAEPASTAWTWAVGGNRWALYASMLFAAGTALFCLLVSIPASVTAEAYRVGKFASLVAAISFILSIGFGGAEMILGGIDALFSLTAWTRGAGSTLLPSAVIGVPAMIILMIGFNGTHQKPKNGILMLGSALAVASFLVTGHAATAPPVWLMATAVAVHLFCSAFWFGALYPLFKATSELDAAQAGAVMHRFSVWAMYSVILIVLTGVVVSWVQVQAVSNLLSTAYGEDLIRKLVLVGMVLAIAAYNKLVLTPQLAKGDTLAPARIRLSIKVEFVVYVFILGAAMTLTLTTPPRAIVDQQGVTQAMDGIKTVLESSGYSAELELTPAKAGENMIMATVKGADGTVLTLADLEITANLPSAGIADVSVKGQAVGNGMWHAVFKEMIIPGSWSVRIDAYVNDFDKVTFNTELEIK